MMNSIKPQASKGVIAAVVVLFLVFAVLIITVGNYYSNNRPADNSISRGINLTESKNNYQKEFTNILSDYLDDDISLAAVTADSFLFKTKEVQKKILNLVVPSEFKDDHLSVIIILSDIKNNTNNGNLEMVFARLYDLREMLNNF